MLLTSWHSGAYFMEPANIWVRHFVSGTVEVKINCTGNKPLLWFHNGLVTNEFIQTNVGFQLQYSNLVEVGGQKQNIGFK